MIQNYFVYVLHFLFHNLWLMFGGCDRVATSPDELFQIEICMSPYEDPLQKPRLGNGYLRLKDHTGKFLWKKYSHAMSVPDDIVWSEGSVTFYVAGERTQLLLDRKVRRPESQNQAYLEYDLVRAVKKEDVQSVTQLLARGADPNGDQRFSGQVDRPLFLTKNLEVLRLLLDHGAEINSRDDQANIVIHRLTGDDENPDDTRTLEFLISRGADVNARNMRGETPLHQARTSEAVKILLRAGASPNVVDVNGETALVSHYNSPEILEILFDARPDFNPDSNEAKKLAAFAVDDLNAAKVIPMLLAKGMSPKTIVQRSSGARTSLEEALLQARRRNRS